jgi:hypothetical protein
MDWPWHAARHPISFVGYAMEHAGGKKKKEKSGGQGTKALTGHF